MDEPGISSFERGESGNPAPAIFAGFDPHHLVEERAFLIGGRALPPDDAESQEVARPDLPGQAYLAATVADVGSGGVIAVRHAIDADARDLDVEREGDAWTAAAFVDWAHGHIFPTG
jgi:hypothetical protein